MRRRLSRKPRPAEKKKPAGQKKSAKQRKLAGKKKPARRRKRAERRKPAKKPLHRVRPLLHTAPIIQLQTLSLQSRRRAITPDLTPARKCSPQPMTPSSNSSPLRDTTRISPPVRDRASAASAASEASAASAADSYPDRAKTGLLDGARFSFFP